MDTERAADRQRATARLIRRGDDEDAGDTVLTGDQRLALTHVLWLESLRIAGIDGNAIRLQRSVTSLQRRSR